MKSAGIRVTVVAMFVALFLAMLVSLAAGQNNMQKESSSLSGQEQHFLEHLAKGSQGEVQISQMVASKTNNSKVKEFAQRMVHDHTVLNAQVQRVLTKHGMSMPQPMTLEQQQLQTKLQGLSGNKLDQAYMSAQLKDHEKDVRDVTQQAQNAKQLQSPDPDVSELAEEALPVLQQHLDFARNVAQQVGVSGGGK